MWLSKGRYILISWRGCSAKGYSSSCINIIMQERCACVDEFNGRNLSSDQRVIKYLFFGHLSFGWVSVIGYVQTCIEGCEVSCLK